MQKDTVRVSELFLFPNRHWGIRLETHSYKAEFTWQIFTDNSNKERNGFRRSIKISFERNDNIKYIWQDIVCKRF